MQKDPVWSHLGSWLKPSNRTEGVGSWRWTIQRLWEQVNQVNTGLQRHHPRHRNCLRGSKRSSRHIRGKQSQHLAWAALSLMSKIKEDLFFLISAYRSSPKRCKKLANKLGWDWGGEEWSREERRETQTCASWGGQPKVGKGRLNTGWGVRFWLIS